MEGTTLFGTPDHQAPGAVGEPVPGATSPVQQEEAGPTGSRSQCGSIAHHTSFPKSSSTQHSRQASRSAADQAKPTTGPLQPPDHAIAAPPWVADLLKTLAEGNNETRKLTQRLADLAQRPPETGERVQGDQPTAPPTAPPEREFSINVIGKFEPSTIPDPDSAYIFIESIRDAVAQFGKLRTRGTLRQFLNSPTAREWYLGLGDKERLELLGSTASWCRVLKRDFMPRAAVLEMQAGKERFRWSQGRRPSEYAAKKVRLLRMAGITAAARVIEEVHAGFVTAPEIHGLLETTVLTCGTVSDYRAAIVRFQDTALALYTSSGASGQKSRLPARPYWEREPVKTRGMGFPDTQATGTAPLRTFKLEVSKGGPPDRRFKRNRKCRNFPRCGDGEHWDDQCPLRASPTVKPNDRRAYYGTENAELLDESSDAEEEYAIAQEGYFEARGRELDALPLADELTGKASLTCVEPGPLTRLTAPELAPPPRETCLLCHEEFGTGNQLHRHLREAGHMATGRKKQSQPVVSSTAEMSVDLQRGLSDFQFAELTVTFGIGDSNQYQICADTGFGNSGIDAGFLQVIEGTTPEVSRSPLAEPRRIRGIGGGVETVTELAIVPVYLSGKGGTARITVTCFVFPSLGCQMLLGNDTLVRESATIVFDKREPHMRIGSCNGIRVPLKVGRREEVSRVTVRAKERTTVPAHSAKVLPIQLARTLDPGQDYIFEARPHPTIETAATPVIKPLNTGIFNYDQCSVLFTNFGDTPLTVQRGTPISYVSSLPASAPYILWSEAALELNAFLGLGGVQEVISQDAEDLGREGEVLKALARDWPAAPIVTTEPGVSCRVLASEPKGGTVTIADLPQWLNQEYTAKHSYPVPPGIVTPLKNTSTYEQVVVNQEIAEAEQEGLQRLVRRHRGLFNDKKGCAREPVTDWLRIPVPADRELAIRPRAPYRLSPKNEAVIDEQYNEHRKTGQLSSCEPSPYGLQVFVVWKNGKPRPVVDMRPLNAMVPADAYPLPRQERIVEAIRGKEYLSTRYHCRLPPTDDSPGGSPPRRHCLPSWPQTIQCCYYGLQEFAPAPATPDG